ncbi:MAG: chemotaxis protein CheX [Acidiferrobacterales bacterium]|nr:chemotaxis protein CheX [Acidiferrobacterales bacterium]
MIEDNMQVFIDSIVNYFTQVSDKKVEVGSPYLLEDNQVIISDYTGVISISGLYEGCCYFTAPRAMLKYLVLALGEIDTSETMLLDAVGEVANTLSGNARREIGKEFIISVPVVFKTRPEDQAFDGGGRTYAIPILCNSYRSLLGIRLSQSNYKVAA